MYHSDTTTTIQDIIEIGCTRKFISRLILKHKDSKMFYNLSQSLSYI